MDILQDHDRQLLTQLCGPCYHPYAEGRYRRAGTRKRRIATRLGADVLTIKRVKDLSGGRTFVPLWEDVLIEHGRLYQKDIVALSISLVQRASYRNTAAEQQRIGGIAPSAMTINRRVQQLGQMLSQCLHQRPLEAPAHNGDGTKLAGQRHRGQSRLIDANIVTAAPQGGETQLRSLTVGCPWQAHRPMIRRTTFRDEQRHGPYHHWTRKVRGKTVCVALYPEEAARLGEWIRNMRQVERILTKMEALTLQAVGLIRG